MLSVEFLHHAVFKPAVEQNFGLHFRRHFREGNIEFFSIGGLSLVRPWSAQECPWGSILTPIFPLSAFIYQRSIYAWFECGRRIIHRVSMTESPRSNPSSRAHVGQQKFGMHRVVEGFPCSRVLRGPWRGPGLLHALWAQDLLYKLCRQMLLYEGEGEGPEHCI